MGDILETAFFALLTIGTIGAGVGVVTHAFSDDVACTGQRGCHIGHALFGADIFRRLSLRIGGGLLLKEQVS